MTTLLTYKGAVQPGSSTAGGNVLYMWKGAVQTSLSIAAILASMKYPRDSMATQEARFTDFIAAAGISNNNDLQDNYKAALAAVLGLDPDLYSIDDLFKRYWILYG